MPLDVSNLQRYLRAALDVDSPAEKTLHARQALQHCDATPAVSAFPLLVPS